MTHQIHVTLCFDPISLLNRSPTLSFEPIHCLRKITMTTLSEKEQNFKSTVIRLLQDIDDNSDSFYWSVFGEKNDGLYVALGLDSVDQLKTLFELFGFISIKRDETKTTLTFKAKAFGKETRLQPVRRGRGNKWHLKLGKTGGSSAYSPSAEPPIKQNRWWKGQIREFKEKAIRMNMLPDTQSNAQSRKRAGATPRPARTKTRNLSATPASLTYRPHDRGQKRGRRITGKTPQPVEKSRNAVAPTPAGPKHGSPSNTPSAVKFMLHTESSLSRIKIRFNGVNTSNDSHLLSEGLPKSPLRPGTRTTTTSPGTLTTTTMTMATESSSLASTGTALTSAVLTSSPSMMERSRTASASLVASEAVIESTNGSHPAVPSKPKPVARRASASEARAVSTKGPPPEAPVKLRPVVRPASATLTASDAAIESTKGSHPAAPAEPRPVAHPTSTMFMASEATENLSRIITPDNEANEPFFPPDDTEQAVYKPSMGIDPLRGQDINSRMMRRQHIEPSMQSAQYSATYQRVNPSTVLHQQLSSYYQGGSQWSGPPYHPMHQLESNSQSSSVQQESPPLYPVEQRVKQNKNDRDEVTLKELKNLLNVGTTELTWSNNENNIPCDSSVRDKRVLLEHFLYKICDGNIATANAVLNLLGKKNREMRMLDEALTRENETNAQIVGGILDFLEHHSRPGWRPTETAAAVAAVASAVSFSSNEQQTSRKAVADLTGLSTRDLKQAEEEINPEMKQHSKPFRAPTAKTRKDSVLAFLQMVIPDIFCHNNRYTRVDSNAKSHQVKAIRIGCGKGNGWWWMGGRVLC